MHLSVSIGGREHSVLARALRKIRVDISFGLKRILMVDSRMDHCCPVVGSH